jgi:hypothetical protein
MSDQFWLTKAQLKRIKPFFPRARGVPRVDNYPDRTGWPTPFGSAEIVSRHNLITADWVIGSRLKFGFR